MTHLEREEIEAEEARRNFSKPSLESLPDHILIQIIVTILNDLHYSTGPDGEIKQIAKVSRRFCGLVYGTPIFWADVSTVGRLDTS